MTKVLLRPQRPPNSAQHPVLASHNEEPCSRDTVAALHDAGGLVDGTIVTPLHTWCIGWHADETSYESACKTRPLTTRIEELRRGSIAGPLDQAVRDQERLLASEQPVFSTLYFPKRRAWQTLAAFDLSGRSAVCPASSMG